MINLFYEGGVLFMSIISFFLIMTGISFYTHSDKLKTYGNLGLASGILGSFIGLYSAFEFIQQAGSVSPVILAGGLGSRLQKTLPNKQKVIAEVGGKPFLIYLLEWIQSYNAQRLILALGYKSREVLNTIKYFKKKFFCLLIYS